MENTDNRLRSKYITEALDIKALEELEETLLGIEWRTVDDRYSIEIRAFREETQKRIDFLLEKEERTLNDNK